jgi:hypothetical protein
MSRSDTPDARGEPADATIMDEPDAITERSEDAPAGGEPRGSRPLIAIVVGSAVLAIVMLLVLLAVSQAPSRDARVFQSRNDKGATSADGSGFVVVEDCVYGVRDAIPGIREFHLQGYVRNTGKHGVKSADLKCSFENGAGEEADFVLPIVVDTHMEGVDGGPLMPMSGRAFGVRIGEFPKELMPEVVRAEVINVRTIDL